MWQQRTSIPLRADEKSRTNASFQTVFQISGKSLLIVKEGILKQDAVFSDVDRHLIKRQTLEYWMRSRFQAVSLPYRDSGALVSARDDFPRV
jgi:hypothetical protein